ncbi:MAG: hypothetical protein Q8N82_02265 [Deltaproteobacteria bacterium]|nr:hypothetical protein [Deltaproteobacteria bacterium]
MVLPFNNVLDLHSIGNSLLRIFYFHIIIQAYNRKSNLIITIANPVTLERPLEKVKSPEGITKRDPELKHKGNNREFRSRTYFSRNDWSRYSHVRIDAYLPEISLPHWLHAVALWLFLTLELFSPCPGIFIAIARPPAD